MENMSETDDLLHELDLAGPLAPLVVLQDIKDHLPRGDANRRFLEGYIAGRIGERSGQWHSLMEDPEFSAGWWAGNRPWGRA